MCLINSIHSYYDTSIPISSLRYFRHVGIPFGRESVVFVATYCYYIQGNMNRFFIFMLHSRCFSILQRINPLVNWTVFHPSLNEWLLCCFHSQHFVILNLTFAQCQCLSKWISPHLGKNWIQFHFYCLHFIGFRFFQVFFVLSNIFP